MVAFHPDRCQTQACQDRSQQGEDLSRREPGIVRPHKEPRVGQTDHTAIVLLLFFHGRTIPKQANGDPVNIFIINGGGGGGFFGQEIPCVGHGRIPQEPTTRKIGINSTDDTRTSQHRDKVPTTNKTETERMGRYGGIVYR